VARTVLALIVAAAGLLAAPVRAGATQACTYGQLHVKLGRGDGATSHLYLPVIFTNVSASDCTLRGYPGVSSVAGAHGRQVGKAATREPGTRRTIKLKAHGGTASALLNHLSAEVVDPKLCDLADSPGFRVYAPDQKRSFYVAKKHTVCTQGTFGDSVRPVVAGRTGVT
jgi:hypothetical protein